MTDRSETFNTIMEPLIGIVEDPNWDSEFVVPLQGTTNTYTTLPSLESGIDDPPSYIVQMLFCSIARFRWSKGDKSAWEIRLIFEGNRYQIQDHRRNSWSIGPIGSSKTNKQHAAQLIKKIRGAAKRLNKLLEPDLKSKIESGNYYLYNSFRHIRRGYEHFRETVEKTHQEISEARTTPPTLSDPLPDVEAVNIPSGGTFTIDHHLTSHLNRLMRLDEAVSHETVAMLSSFFSYLELLLDAIFAFQPDRALSYLEFRRKTWDERFKMLLPISRDADLRQTYNELRLLRKGIRDQMSHGLGGPSGLLVPFGQFGLIPTSFEVLINDVKFSWQVVSTEESVEILEVCAAFDKWIHDFDETWYVLRFIEFGVEIPFEPNRVAEIRSWMTSREDFESALEKWAEELDYLQDQY